MARSINALTRGYLSLSGGNARMGFVRSMDRDELLSVVTHFGFRGLGESSDSDLCAIAQSALSGHEANVMAQKFHEFGGADLQETLAIDIDAEVEDGGDI